MDRKSDVIKVTIKRSLKTRTNKKKNLIKSILTTTVLCILYK